MNKANQAGQAEELIHYASGKLVNAVTDKVLAGFKVEAWDKGKETSEPLGTATSDSEGNFLIPFDESRFIDTSGNKLPNVFFRIFVGETLVHSTESKPQKNLSSIDNLEINISLAIDEEDKKIAETIEKTVYQPKDILKIKEVADQSPKAFKKAKPALYKQLQSKALEHFKKDLAEKFKDSGYEIRLFIQQLDLVDFPEHKGDIISYLTDHVQKSTLSESARSEALHTLEDWQTAKTLSELLPEDSPISQSIVLSDELHQASLYEVLDVSELSNKTFEGLVKADFSIQENNKENVEKLVTEGVIADEKAAASLALNADLYQLASENIGLVKAIHDSPITGDVRSSRNLAKMTSEHWKTLIDENKVTTPRGIEPRVYADTLRLNIEQQFPNDVFSERFQNTLDRGVVSHINTIAPVIKNNPQVFFTPTILAPFQDLNLNKVDKEKLPKIDASYTQVKTFVNRYPGLGIGQLLLDDTYKTSTQKRNEAQRRIDLFQSFWDKNKDHSPLLTTSFMPESKDLDKLDFSGIDDTDRIRITAGLMANQRIFQVTNDIEAIPVFFENGYDSAQAIRVLGFSTFFATTKFEYTVAKKYYDASSDIVINALQFFATSMDAGQHTGSIPPIDNTSPEIHRYLRKINGYSEFFGKQDYCDCKHCESIISPAAYFVDLMSFIQSRIIEYNKVLNENQQHDLQLKVRRPDLWNGLPLNCDSTHTLTPYLTIILEILESFIERKKHTTTEEQLTDRQSVEKFVYGEVGKLTVADENEPDKEISQINSFSQPYHLPLVELETYLQHFPITRAELAKTVHRYESGDEVKNTIAQAELLLSPEEYYLIETPNTDSDFLSKVFGFKVPADKGEYPESKMLFRRMKISRDELDALLKTQFVRASDEHAPRLASPDSYLIHLLSTGNQSKAEAVKNELNNEDDAVTIRTSEKNSTTIYNVTLGGYEYKHDAETKLKEMRAKYPNSGLIKDSQVARIDNTVTLQKNTEVIRNLTLENADRMHRLIRLWYKLDWSISELDQVLIQMQKAGLLSDNNALQLTAISDVLLLQKALNLSVTDLLILIHDVDEKHPSQFLQNRFDLPVFLRDEVAWATDAFDVAKHTFLHPAFNQQLPDDSQVNIQHRLIAGIGINDDGLSSLIEHLLHLYAASSGSKKIKLSHTALCNLYRHAQIAKSLKLDMDELFVFIRLSQNHSESSDKPKSIASLEHVQAIVELREWQKNSQYSVEELAILLNDPYREGEESTEYINSAEALVKSIKSAKKHMFAGTVLALVEGINEDQSRNFIQGETNKALFTKSDNEDLYSLNKTFLTSTLTLPEGINVSPEDISEDLSRYLPSQLISSEIADSLGLSEAKLTTFLSMLKIRLSDHEKELMSVFYADEEAGADYQFINSWIAAIKKLTIWFKAKKFDSLVLGTIQKSNVFLNTDFDKPSLDDLQQTTSLNKLLPKETKSQEVFFSLLEEVESDTRSLKFKPDASPMLVKYLSVKQGLINSINSVIVFPKYTSAGTDVSAYDAIHALDKFKACAELATTLGIGGEGLSLLVSPPLTEGQADNFERSYHASKLLMTAIRSQYDTEKEFKEVVSDYSDKVREWKRDALTDYILHSIKPANFDKPSDLYQYFLIDTELEGCARTSRLVAGISSLQLYIQRVIMNVEQTPLGITPQLQTQLEPNARNEWEWRKNYRVWEANRKVFLYPENYIEPDLRDNKTELFKDLETLLLQQDINAQTVEEAYIQYLKGFDEVANLKIAGAYHDRDDGKDTLHLFGVTADEPPQYYYRTVDNLYKSIQDTPKRGVVWHPWDKLQLQIPVRKVSPVVFKGKLYLFWVQITTRPKNEAIDGSSIFAGYDHSISINYSSQNLDHTWCPLQEVGTNKKIFKERFPKQHLMSALFDKAKLYIPPEERSNTPPGIISSRTYVTVHSNKENASAFFQSLIKTIKKEPNLILESENIKVSYSVYQEHHTLHVNIKWEEVKYVLLHIEPDEGHTLKDFRWNSVYPTVYMEKLYLTYISKDQGEAIKGKVLDVNTRKISDDFGGNYGGILVSGHSISRRLRAVGTMPYGIVNYSSPPEKFADAARIAYLFSEGDGKKDKRTIYNSRFEQGKIFPNNPLRGNIILHSLINGACSNIFVEKNKGVFLLKSIQDEYLDYSIEQIGTSINDDMVLDIRNRGVEKFLGFSSQRNLSEDISIFSEVSKKVNTPKHYDINYKGSLGVYYREIFFHIPFLIANHLNSQGTYEDAQYWYNFIFDPTSNNLPDDLASIKDKLKRKKRENDRVWQYLEFRAHTLKTIEAQLSDYDSVETYRKDPFNPHAIARLRLGAYMKSIVMKYIDNLLDWGDHLFAKDTMESINEATMLYVMATDILGERPVELGDCDKVSDKDFTYDSYVNDPSLARNNIFTQAAEAQSYSNARPSNFSATSTKESEQLASFAASFLQQANIFCIPKNKDLMDYWDRVEDRLYKIRNCLNIKGIRRELSLFSPEIDPRLLVRAKAAGLSLEDALDTISGNLPPYRFTYLIAKAKEYVGTLQSFSSQLLSAIDKKDAEALAQMQFVHRQSIHKLTTKLRDNEIDSAKENLLSLELRQKTVEERCQHYIDLIGEGLIDYESAQQITKISSQGLQTAAIPFALAASQLKFAPSIVGFSFSTPTDGAAEALDIAVSVQNILSSVAVNAAEMLGVQGGNTRREEQWKFSRDQANLELKEIEKQIEVAKLRLEIAQHSKETHLIEVEQLQEVYDTFYKGKFTPLGRYTWLSAQMQRLHREAYQNAIAVARLAERAYRFERNDETTPLLDGNYWEGDFPGLLAGNNLQNDLISMEREFIETNYRNMEIDQTFSLSQIDPQQLINLKNDGSCTFTLPEFYFDMSYPGHYRRMIKAVRLSIPCITGPYTNIGATLTLLKSEIRKEPKLETPPVQVPPSRSTSIATSKGQNDSGVFQLDFRDERYMPFEGCGAVNSEWKLELPKVIKAFDYSTISDVMLHISYTAEHDGAFKEAVETKAEEDINAVLENVTLERMMSLKHEFPEAYQKLALTHGENEVVEINLSSKHFPIFMQGRDIEISPELIDYEGKATSNISVLSKPSENNESMFSLSIKKESAEVNIGVDIYIKVKFSSEA